VNVFSAMQKNIKNNKAPVSQYHNATPGLNSAKSLDVKNGVHGNLQGSSSHQNLVSKYGISAKESALYNFKSAYSSN